MRGRPATVETLLEDGNVTFMKHEGGESGESRAHRGGGVCLGEDPESVVALLGPKGLGEPEVFGETPWAPRA